MWGQLPLRLRSGQALGCPSSEARQLFCCTSSRNALLVRRFVVARLAAGFAIHETIAANADVDHRLAEAAEFFALARVLGLFALRATVFGGTGSGTHKNTVA